MLDRLAPLTHGVRVFVESLLHRFDYLLMFPSRDAALRSFRAMSLERTGPARVRPITVEFLTFFFVGIIILQFLTGRAAIGVLRRQIDEVLLAEAAFRFRPRRHRLGERHRDAGLLAGQ